MMLNSIRHIFRIFRDGFPVTTLLLTMLLVSLRSSEARGSDDEIRKKETALKRLREEIDTYEQRIKESEQKERVTLDRIDNYEKQSNLIKSYMSQLIDEEQHIRRSIAMTMENIAFLERQLNFLKLHYAKYVVSVYKFGRVYDLETILSSKSINQLYIRIAYLKKFSEQRRADLQRIVDKKVLLEDERSSLQSKLDRERQIITSKQEEERVLGEKTRKRKQALIDIRKDRTSFKKELDRKTLAAQQLESLITDLIEQERIRRERAARIARERAAEAERARLLPIEKEAEPPSVTFVTLKGKLPWPVNSGAVVAQFGNQIHPVLKTVTQNTGIDISVRNGSPVKAVAEGEVSMIHWLPSYGNLIILNHFDGYRTVYAHLSDIGVIEGQRVSEGAIIAKSGDSVSGSVLHFELWKDRDKQNPESWLSRRHR